MFLNVKLFFIKINLSLSGNYKYIKNGFFGLMLLFLKDQIQSTVK